jgi:ERCC4-type nuclease
MKLEDFIVIIDSREIASNIEQIVKILSEYKIQTQVQPLNPGDFRIMLNNECVSIWERKHTDLLSSITTNHFHEQRDRMIQTGMPIHKLVLVIEGNKHTKKNYPLCQSVITSTAQIGFTILYTLNIEDTAKTICYYINSFIKHSINQIDSQSPINSHLNIKKVNTQPDTFYSSCLRLIPGVSEEVALNIIKHYPTLLLLIQAFQTSPKPQELLTDVCYTNKKAKKLSEKIHEYFSKMLQN